MYNEVSKYHFNPLTSFRDKNSKKGSFFSVPG